jgi:hypothetical protein
VTASGAAAPSPRTDAEPFAFTRDEFLDGAFAAWWLSASAVGVIIMAAMPMHIGFAGMLAALMATLCVALLGFPAMMLFAPVVWLVGRSMRKVQRMSVHLAVQTAAGLVIGVLSTIAVLSLFGAVPFLLGGVPLFAAGPAIGLPLAWFRAYRRAWRSDAGLLPPSPPDPDAVVEDAIDERSRSAD